MSEIKVNSIKGVGASTAAITVNNTDGSCTANLTNRTNKNLVVNGACLIAQRGTSSTSSGYQTVDRFTSYQNGLDEAPTYSQGDVSSGTTPYTNGFRKTFKIQNGNQTSAGADDHMVFEYRVEDQDIATSGWNYLSSSSNISFSFWVKSSVAQNFYFMFQSDNGSTYRYVMETGSLSANTWTKITKTIPGNSNLVFNNDTGLGMYISWHLFDGTNRTGTRPLNAWAAADNSSRTPDQTSTWYTTNDATFEITGLQLEVSDHATDFEHRPFGQELALCQRYFQRFATGDGANIGIGFYYTSSQLITVLNYLVPMRATPTFSMISGTHYYVVYRDGAADTFNSFTLSSGVNTNLRCEVYNNSDISGTAGHAGVVRCNNAAPNGGQLDLSAEL